MNETRFLARLAFCLLAGCLGSAWAIDNPDAPNRVADFLNRSRAHEAAIQQMSYTTQGYVAAFASYEQFLDEELNKAYRLLMRNLDEQPKEQLRRAQRKWLEYRDAEFAFVAGNWTPGNFGSSSVLSRGQYRTYLIKNRVLMLLEYLRNY